MESNERRVYNVEPAVKFVGRASVWVAADTEEEAIARAERAIINDEDRFIQGAFDRLKQEDQNVGVSGSLEGDSVVFDSVSEDDLSSRQNSLEAANNELEQARERGTNQFTIIAYDEEKATRIRMGVQGNIPEDAIREFFRQFCEQNYAPTVTFDFGQPLGQLEEAMDVIVLSCHEGLSDERIQEAMS